MVPRFIRGQRLFRLVILDRLDDRTVVFQILPEEYLVARDMHLVGRAMQLTAELGQRHLGFLVGRRRLDRLLDL